MEARGVVAAPVGLVAAEGTRVAAERAMVGVVMGLVHLAGAPEALVALVSCTVDVAAREAPEAEAMVTLTRK